MRFDEWASQDRQRKAGITLERLGSEVWSVLEKAYTDGYTEGRKEHPDPRYRAIRANNKKLRIDNRLLHELHARRQLDAARERSDYIARFGPSCGPGEQ